MLQTFDSLSDPSTGPARLAALRAEIRLQQRAVLGNVADPHRDRSIAGVDLRGEEHARPFVVALGDGKHTHFASSFG